ncbi:hypothetical protein N7U66_06800 [Lacinutrix neustonica]|uniref:Uncharacterized protein n=1 Tax=Lacinutrix neustonica TaxID=2980107 RepID=A0A9E8SEZ1_9FLAO|nr:hypothetical protein [Lacinutrix neustonica]WAC03272.1 hypothetical protein N7U66_06800 [Lacinutrix neustonica]
MANGHLKPFRDADDETDLYFTLDKKEDDKWTGKGEFILPRLWQTRYISKFYG